MSKRLFSLFNFAWFQAIWWLAILFQYKYFWLIVVLIAGHFLLSKSKIDDLKCALVGIIASCAVDYPLTRLGVLEFNDGSGFIVPLWLVCIWLAFTCTITRSLSFMRYKYALGAGLAAVSGTMNYIAGARLGAVTLPFDILTSAAYIGVFWACAFPAINFIINEWIVEGEKTINLQLSSE